MLLPTKEVAERLQVHPATVRRWTASGRLRYVRIGRQRAIPVEEVRRLQRQVGREGRQPRSRSPFSRVEPASVQSHVEVAQ